jgi:predicted Zn-dependent protease
MSLRNAFLSLAAATVALGGSLAQAQGLRTLRDAEIEIFIDDYARPIFRVAGLPEDSIQIIIVNDGSFNAFAGGRYMGVNTGLLTIADTPNQIESVIAHEAGHLAGGHSARTGDAMAAASRPMLLSLVLAGAAIAAGAPEAGMGILGLGQTIGRANFLSYSRGQESTADQASITYLDKLGHSSTGAVEIWRKMRNSQIIRGYRINPYSQTHPMANVRLSALQRRVVASPYYDRKDSPEEIERLHYIQAKIYGFLHDPEVALRTYPLTDQSGPAQYARAVAFYRTGLIDKGLIEIRKLTAAQPDNPFFHELEGQMLFEFGRAREAVGPHRRSTELLTDNALLRINLGRALLATGDYADREEAVKELKRALLLESDNSFGWFELARAYGAMDNETLAILATAESRYYAGAKHDANLFARRAINRLRRGTPEWRQAADIILATQPESGGLPLPAGADDDEAPAPSKPTSEEKRGPDVPDPAFAGPQGF